MAQNEFKVNLNALKVIMSGYSQLYKKMMKYGESLLSGQVSNTVENLKNFYSKCTGIYLMDYIFWIGMFEDQIDLFYKEQDHPDWILINQHLKTEVLNPDEKVVKGFKGTTDNLAIAMAGISRSTNYTPGFKRKFMNTSYNAHYFFRPALRFTQMEFFKSNPDLKTSAICWGLMENKVINSMMCLGFEKVTYNKCIHIPKTQPPITLGNIDNLPNYENWKSLLNDTMESQPLLICGDFAHNPETHVQIRVITRKLFKTMPEAYVGKKAAKTVFTCSDKTEGIDTLVIHVHGGGFIATSSASHQNYLRSWSNSVPNAAFFSIDYSLSPKSKFPGALDESWQAYTWLILNAKKVFGIDYKKVILTGDSAGGNLIIALTLMSINRKFRVPDSILPMYPVTICSQERFYPSLLNSFDDAILTNAILGLVMKAYAPEGEHRFIGSHNQYMSPGICASDAALSQFPPVRLFLSGIDPLKDDGLFFLHKLLKNNVDVKAVEFRMMPHGFLSYALPIKGMVEAQKCIDITAECMRGLAGTEVE